MREKIKVFLADDNNFFINILKEFLSNQEDIEVIGMAEDGRDAYEGITTLNPEVVIMDMVMPYLDGIEILEKFKSEKGKKRPIFIVLSGVRREEIIERAMNLGANYYITKPFDLAVLANRVRELYNENKKMDDSNGNKIYKKNASLQERVTNIMCLLGVPAHIKGYRYLRDAIIMVIENYDVLDAVTRLLYPTIAQKHKTTPSRVERAIRHAIEVSCQRGQIEFMEEIFGYTINSGKGKPTNSEFVAMIADKLVLEMRKSEEIKAR